MGAYIGSHDEENQMITIKDCYFKHRPKGVTLMSGLPLPINDEGCVRDIYFIDCTFHPNCRKVLFVDCEFQDCDDTYLDKCTSQDLA
jgi:hypothetical protein